MAINKGVVGTFVRDINKTGFYPGITLIDETYLQQRVGVVFFYPLLKNKKGEIENGFW